MKTLLHRYLGRHDEPPAGQVTAAVDRVWSRLAPEAVQPGVRLPWPAEAAPRRRQPDLRLAAAAAVLIAAIGTAILWPRGPQVYTTDNAGLQFTLADDSRVEMRAHSALTVDRADDGLRINLHKGGIIVNAAKQRDGQLYVQTKDMTVAVVGTVFLVSADEAGSRVAVIEGEVRVRDGGRETNLRAGEQVTTSAQQVRPVTEEIAWSRSAVAHTALLQRSVPPALTQAAASAQVPAARPRFEEASVRPCLEEPSASEGRGGGANSLTMTPGRFHAQCLTLATLIRTAYGYGPMALGSGTINPRDRAGVNMRFGQVYGLGVEDGQRVRGTADWVRSDRYTIEAVADAAADADTMRGSMLQDLLERRFQLRVHVEAEQVPGFALTVAPGGLKIKPMQPGDCSSDPLPEAVRVERERKGWSGPVLITEAKHFGIKPTCGFIYGEQNGPNFRIEAANSPGRVPIGGALDARVVDRTGITDMYLFVFEYGPDETTPGANRMILAERPWTPKPGFDGPATLPKAASLATALEEQLGLKLDPIRVPREFLVVDRVERPGPN